MSSESCSDSKRGSVRELIDQFDIELSLPAVYSMMDLLDDKRVDLACELVGKASLSFLREQTVVAYADCTALFFESAKEDGFRQKGYSKDSRHGETQVLLPLLVSRGGLPLCCDVHSGDTWEGSSLALLLQKTLRLLQIEQMVCVADRGMFSRDNLASLDELGVGYVVGAKLRSLSTGWREEMLRLGNYRSIEGGTGVWLPNGIVRGVA